MGYTKTYLVCQEYKIDKQKSWELLEPLSVPTRPWESASMDFINELLNVDQFSSTIIVIYRFSKYSTFAPIKETCGAEETAALFFKHIVKYWGLPQSIVSDRDHRFTSIFRSELFQIMGSWDQLLTCRQATTLTPIFKETEWAFGKYLRHFVSVNQKD